MDKSEFWIGAAVGFGAYYLYLKFRKPVAK
jgi:hypothetical protein